MRPFTAKLPDAKIDAGAGVDLRALTRADEDRLDALLTEPEVAEWFDADGGELVALIEDPSVTPYLIRRDGAPVGYAQVYHANADPFWRGLGMPRETMGIDLSLGGAQNRGAGIGPRVIDALIGRMFGMDRVVQIIIDPHPDNARAVRAYGKCGFTFGQPQPGYYGEPMLLGVLRREDWRPS
jgi:aminoglycoside 6'-N-acetyltransferase